MLGFTEPPQPEEVLALDMYSFLIDPIRLKDRLDGNLFVKRFFEGPQAVWEQNQTAVFDLKSLWSITEIDDAFLQYLKNIVGWTKELDFITSALDATTLRRLIAASVPLWRTRGPEDTILNILRLTTGARRRIWNWFDFRWVLDETELGYEQEGRDPWLIDLPGPPSDDDRRMNLRIVDHAPNVLDRTLVKNLVNLLRPSGENIEISYLAFMDLFSVGGDNFQWTMATGGTDLDLVVADGLLKLLDDTTAQHAVVTGIDGADDWSDYVVAQRQRTIPGVGSGWAGFMFYRVDADNWYWVGLKSDVGTYGAVRVGKSVAGVVTSFGTYLFTAGEQIFDDVFYMLRVDVVPEGGGNRIRVYVDGDLKINTTDAAHSKGTLAVFHNAGVGVEVDEIEMWLNPLETETVGINFGS
jgi:hypothetical protein